MIPLSVHSGTASSRLLSTLGCAVLLSLASVHGNAAATGQSLVRMCGAGISGYCSIDTRPLPWWAMQFETPVLNMARNTDHSQASVEARVGIDVPAGVLSIKHRLSEDVWSIVNAPDLYTEGRIEFRDVIEVRSPILPEGAWVDFQVAGALFWDVPDFYATHGSFHNNVLWATICLSRIQPAGCMYTPIPNQVLVAHGSWDFGTVPVRAQIGDDLDLAVSLSMWGSAMASAGYDWVNGHNVLHTGHTRLNSAVALFFGVEAGAPPAAVAAMAALAPAEFELYSRALGGALPGFEVFDEENIRAHLQPIPAPSALALFLPGLAVAALRSRRRMGSPQPEAG